MSPDVVVDIGNSRIKFGRCSQTGIAELASLPSNDAAVWKSQIETWGLSHGDRFAIASVVPARAVQLRDWLEREGFRTTTINDPSRLPIRVGVPEPAKVGIDRLLTATAVQFRSPGKESVAVTAGTAVTVDFIRNGTFQGGAIMPGFATMLHALHEHTALLPDVEITEPVQKVIGANTIEAMRAGVFEAVAGGVASIIREGSNGELPAVYLTGGDGHLLHKRLQQSFQVHSVPTLTLEGIRLAAEALP